MTETIELEKMLPMTHGNGSQQPGGLLSVEAQRAVAEVQSALMIAKSFPRNQKQAYLEIINACKRYTLAERGIYQYARGGTVIEGASIRLMESIAQNWGNVEFGFRELARGFDKDGVTYSEVESYAWDMQTNTRRSVKFRVRHWRDTKKGGYMLTDERDIYELIANHAARRTRSCIQALIPGDIVEAATEQCTRTLEEGEGEPLRERIARMVVAFEKFGVSETMIEARVQRKVDAITAHQIADLQKVYNSIKDGVGGIGDFFTLPEQEDNQKDKKSRTETLKDTLKGKSETKTKGKETIKGDSETKQGKGEKPEPDTTDLLLAIAEASAPEEIERLEQSVAKLPQGAKREEAETKLAERQKAIRRASHE